MRDVTTAMCALCKGQMSKMKPQKWGLYEASKGEQLTTRNVQLTSDSEIWKAKGKKCKLIALIKAESMTL